ncbi:hypothetical protein SDC9_208096 [bioreactor metagenome]|uniref:Uncharacterized protein n=1 Tax=bioreactor metagenome TaxID=1076179 RepID=A0A645J9N3_9ZZZZ
MPSAPNSLDNIIEKTNFRTPVAELEIVSNAEFLKKLSFFIYCPLLTIININNYENGQYFILNIRSLKLKFILLSICSQNIFLVSRAYFIGYVACAVVEVHIKVTVNSILSIAICRGVRHSSHTYS